MTTLNLATRIDYKVYIAGVLVPCSQVTVTTSAPGTSSAQISLPAHPLLIGLGETDRLQVAIFYLDSSRPDGVLQWCLLFEGYLAGQNYVSSPLSREVTFFAMSNISIFNSLYLEFLGGKGRGKVGKADKITPDEITMKGNYPRRFFTQGLKNKVYVTRAFDLIGNIFLATTGRFLDRDIASKTSTKNVDQQITRLVEIAAINRKRQRQTTIVGKLAQAQELLASVKAEKKSAEFSSKIEGIDDSTDGGAETLDGILAQLDYELISEEIKENVGKRNTFIRTPANTGFFARFFNLTKLEQHFVASPIIEGYPDEDVTKMPSGMFPILRTSRGKKYMRAVTRQTGRKYGEGGNVSSFLTNLFSISNYELTDILAPPVYLTDDNGLPKAPFKKGDKNNRIAQHITKPNTPYGLPPSCNAIFPCMIRTWSLGKQYGSVPTRVYYERASQGRRLNVKSSKKGYADHGTHVGYPAKVTRHAQDASKLKTSSLEVLVFPEEYYRGPTSSFNQINPLLYEIKKLETAGRLKEVNKLSAEDKSLFAKDPIPADQLNYLDEALVHAKAKGNTSYGLYVKQAQVDYTTARTAGTAVTVSTIFNPNMVAGFSCMLFDSYESNCHMVGYVRQITHTLAQGQCSTNISLSNARPLREMLTGIMNQGGQYAMHPLEPLTEVREVFQVEEAANYYYGNLLYRNESNFDLGEVSISAAKVKSLEAEVAKLQQELVEMEEEASLFQEEETTALENTHIEEERERLELAILSKQMEVGDAANSVDSASAGASFNYVLNWKALVDLVSSNESSEYIFKDLNAFIGSQSEATSKEDRRTNYLQLLRGHIRPKKALEGLFYSLPLALRFVSRPICTLEEYIDFYKSAPDFISGASAITGGRGRGTRAGKEFLDKDSGQAKYYKLIREFVGGPGFEPGSKVSTKAKITENADVPQLALELDYRTGSESGAIIQKVFTQLNEGATASVQDLPDLARDAQEVLLLYADIIRSRGEL